MLGKVHAIKDGPSTRPRCTCMLQITMPHENREGNELHFHEMHHDPLCLYWHVDILMRSVGNAQLRGLSSCRNDEEFGSGSVAMVEVLVTKLCRTVPLCDQETTIGFQEPETLRR